MTAPDLVGTTMSAMLIQAQAALVPPVGRAALYPGAEVAWDDCCDGQVWVRLISVLPQGSGPQIFSQPCGVVMWIVTFGIGVVRCVAGLDDEGIAPTPAQLNTDTLQMTKDYTALTQAIQCGMSTLGEKLAFVHWDPQGPQGDCAGGEWIITLKISNCPCP